MDTERSKIEKGRIISEIRKRQGITTRSLGKRIRIHFSDLSYYLYQLERKDVVSVKSKKIYTNENNRNCKKYILESQVNLYNKELMEIEDYLWLNPGSNLTQVKKHFKLKDTPYLLTLLEELDSIVKLNDFSDRYIPKPITER